MQTFSRYMDILEEGWKAVVKQYDLTDEDKKWVEDVMAPLGNMKYAQWFVKNFIQTKFLSHHTNRQHPALINVSVNKMNETIGGYFKLFDKYQNSHKKDINSFKSFTEFLDFLIPYIAKEENKNMKNQLASEGSDVLLDNKWFTIHLIKSFEASCKLGMKGVWCTTIADNPTYYNDYTRSGNTTFAYLVFKEKSDKFIGEGVTHYVGGGLASYDGMAAQFKKIAIQFNDNVLVELDGPLGKAGVGTLYTSWDAQNTSDVHWVNKFLNAVLAKEWDKVVKPVKKYITSGEKSEMLKPKAVKAIEMLISKQIKFSAAEPHLTPAFKASSFVVDLDADGISIDLKDPADIPLYVYSQLSKDILMGQATTRQLYLGEQTIFDVLPDDVIQAFSIDGQTVADITTYRISREEEKTLKKLLTTPPMLKTVKYKDASSAPALSSDFDNEATIALNYDHNKFMKLSVPNGAEYALGLALLDDFNNAMDAAMKSIFSENKKFVLSWSDFLGGGQHSNMDGPMVDYVLRDAILKDVEGTNVQIPNITSMMYIVSKARDYRGWMNPETPSGKNILSIRKDHNTDEFEYWIDKFKHTFVIQIKSRGSKGEYYWEDATFESADTASKAIQENDFYDTDPDISSIDIVDIDSGDVINVWEEADALDDVGSDGEQPGEFKVPDDFVWWSTGSRGGYNFQYPPKTGSWADNFIRFLQTDPEDNTVQGFYAWLGRGRRAHGNMADFFTAIKDSGIVAGTLTGPYRTYEYTIGPNYELWKQGKIGAAMRDPKWGPKEGHGWATYRGGWRQTAWNNISSEYQSYQDRPRWNTEIELQQARRVEEGVNTFSSFIEDIDHTSQKQSANHRSGGVPDWLDIDEFDFEGIEDDPEEEAMLKGEPGFGKSTGNAYGGPLPPA